MYEKADISAKIVYDGTVTSWNDRVIRWPVIRRDILGGLSNIVSFDLELADTDLEIYGSFNGTSPFNKEVAIITTITDQANFGANLLQEGDFEGGMTGWYSNDANIIFNRTNVTPIADSWSGTLTYDLAYWSAGYQDFTIGSGTTYEVTFVAKEIHPDMQFGVYDSSSHVTKWTGWTTDIDVTGAAVGTYRSQFTSGAAGVAYFCWLMKQTGASVATAWLDNCVVRTVGITQTATQFIGKVTDLTYQDNKVGLIVRDNLDRINNARFQWRYRNLAFTHDGTLYGTVTRTDGSTIYFDDHSDTIKAILTPYKIDHIPDIDWQNINIPLAEARAKVIPWPTNITYEEWLYTRGLITEDDIAPGNMVKFHTGSFNADDTLGTMLSTPNYRISSGTLLYGTEGTIVIDALNPDVQAGMFIYLEEPLYFSGNPGQIIYDMLTGSLTSCDFTASDIDTAEWGSGTAITAQMVLAKKITNRGVGAVLNEIKSINNEIDALCFINENNQFVWQPYSPFDYPDKNGLNWYNEEDTEDVSYRKGLDDVTTDLTYTYGWLYWEPRSGAQKEYQKQVYGSNGTDAYDQFANYSDKNLTWIHDDETAKTLLYRELEKKSQPFGKFTFGGPIVFGTNLTGDDIILTHRMGQLGTNHFRLFSKEVDIGRSRSTFELFNTFEYYRGTGFGFVEDSSGVHSCSGTSTAAWGWYSGNNGALTAILGVGITTMYCDNNSFSADDWLVIENEILLVTAVVDIDPGGTYTVVRSKLTTEDPLHQIGEVIIQYSGTPSMVFDTEFVGTVHNINTGTYGTFFRWW